eukprot:TRINITY_DN76360_c0_g1_i1.p1 TRINITY_DN76360_c0_g1~~TRINITY_DN76360_c0_g1_i1.p1  ORF type:complete len:431 (-),score=82.38 TRINITY_DN76360_c0_g1_i1:277-1530(-)
MGSMCLQSFILAFNACTSPKQALRLVQEVSKVASIYVSLSSDAVEVCCTSIAGSMLASCKFSLDACITELAAKLRDAQSHDEIVMTGLTFLTDTGCEVNEGEYLKDQTTLAVKFHLTASDAGRLMYLAGDTVSVQMLGQCLGNHDKFWTHLAVAYPQHFTCFKGMDLVQAIRTYMWRFRLPGEAAQIERILEGFARSYFQYNSTTYTEEVDNAGSDSDSESGNQKTAGTNSSLTWQSSHGWYVQQPLSGPKFQPCCAHCGNLDGDAGDLAACQGCKVIHFCRKCRRDASKYGHAFVGMFGYGRACVAARCAIGLPGADREITYMTTGGLDRTVAVSKQNLDWMQASPFKSQDSVFILSFAIIMLTTNLHSANVKDKMKKHEFIKQNRLVNGGCNFPGDFLSKIYDDVQREELKVMRE